MCLNMFTKLHIGGKCSICGYNKYYGALEFHHLDPNIKENGKQAITNIKKEFLYEELDKCVLLCSNCHREVHANLIQI